MEVFILTFDENLCITLRTTIINILSRRAEVLDTQHIMLARNYRMQPLVRQ